MTRCSDRSGPTQGRKRTAGQVQVEQPPHLKSHNSIQPRRQPLASRQAISAAGLWPVRSWGTANKHRGIGGLSRAAPGTAMGTPATPKPYHYRFKSLVCRLFACHTEAVCQQRHNQGAGTRSPNRAASIINAVRIPSPLLQKRRHDAQQNQNQAGSENFNPDHGKYVNNPSRPPTVTNTADDSDKA